MTRTITTEAELDALPEPFRYPVEIYGVPVACAAATALIAITDGGHGRTVNSELRWLALTAVRDIVPGQPAPTVKPSRDDVARAIVPRPWSDEWWPSIEHGETRSFDELREADKNAARVYADAVLALLPGRTEAEVKAEALREAAEEVHRIDPHWDSALCIDGIYHPIPDWLRARADEVERGEGRG